MTMKQSFLRIAVLIIRMEMYFDCLFLTLPGSFSKIDPISRRNPYNNHQVSVDRTLFSSSVKRERKKRRKDALHLPPDDCLSFSATHPD